LADQAPEEFLRGQETCVEIGSVWMMESAVERVLMDIVQCISAQCSTVLYSTVLYSTV